MPGEPDDFNGRLRRSREGYTAGGVTFHWTSGVFQMLVRRLDVYHYLTASSWEEQTARNPTMEQIEEAVRRLDRFHYPWVWLRLTEEQTDDNYMTVMGGNGAYWLSISVDGLDQRRVSFPDQGSDEVQVWTSDQGFSDEQRHICFDIEIVLKAAKFFADTADFDPTLPWESQERLSDRTP